MDSVDDDPGTSDTTNLGTDLGTPQERTQTRRRYLRTAVGLAGTAVAAGCTGAWTVLSGGKNRSSPEASERRQALDPDDLTAEPMNTRIRSIDGTNVLYQYGQPVPTFETWNGNTSARGHHSLNGMWQFRFDDENEGIDRGWHGSAVDDAGWTEVRVPLPWDLYDTPEFGSYDGDVYGRGTAFRDGYAWYRTRFVPDRSWTGRVTRLHFLGVSYMAWVFLNGTLVAQHEGGHTPFSLDVSDHVRTGEENVLAVRVYRRPWWDSDTDPNPTPITRTTQIPAKPVDYWPYAGITRGVYLESTPLLTVSKVLIDASDGTFNLRAIIENRGTSPRECRVRVDPGDGTGGEPAERHIEVAAGTVRVPEFDIGILDADRWAPSDPVLYRATVAVADDDGVLDALAVGYGHRSVSTTDAQLSLNGSPVFLKGVNWHEETPIHGRSLRPDEYDELLSTLEDLNANFLRNSHYSRHPYLYEAADKAGVIVMDEVENMWLDEAHQRTQLRYGLSRALVAAMVWNQHNRPSVGLWSVHNECNASSAVYNRWIRELLEVANTLDIQGRPVMWASHTPTDPAFDQADVIGLNEYFGYFTGSDDNLGSVLEWLHHSNPETPILITENGTWSAPEYRGEPAGSPDTPGTPEWQVVKFWEHWRQVATDHRRSFCTGYSFWNLKDYKTHLDYNRFNYNGISTMGLLSFDGETKTLVYDAFKSASVTE